METIWSNAFHGRETMREEGLCRALPEHSPSPQASNPNLRPPFTSRARRAHAFLRWRSTS